MDKEQAALKDLHWWIDEEVHSKEANQKLHELVDSAQSRLNASTPDAISRAIYVMNAFGWGNPGAKHHFDLAVLALQGYQIEPCPECVKWEDRNAQIAEMYKHYEQVRSSPIYTHCPDCGRKIKSDIKCLTGSEFITAGCIQQSLNEE